MRSDRRKSSKRSLIEVKFRLDCSCWKIARMSVLSGSLIEKLCEKTTLNSRSISNSTRIKYLGELTYISTKTISERLSKDQRLLPPKKEKRKERISKKENTFQKICSSEQRFGQAKRRPLCWWKLKQDNVLQTPWTTGRRGWKRGGGGEGGGGWNR